MKIAKQLSLTFLTFFTLLGSLLVASPSEAAPISIVSQAQGKTPFIWNVTIRVLNIPNLESVQFSIRPKAGSSTAPISAIYSSAYLKSQNRINQELGQVTIPVFGLYASTQTNLNSVTISVRSGPSNSSVQDLITTTPWSLSPYTSPTKVIARNNVKLDYSFSTYANLPVTALVPFSLIPTAKSGGSEP